jgi:hypothetical protein
MARKKTGMASDAEHPIGWRELPCPKWGRVDREYSARISLRFPKRIIAGGDLRV